MILFVTVLGELLELNQQLLNYLVIINEIASNPAFLKVLCKNFFEFPPYPKITLYFLVYSFSM